MQYNLSIIQDVLAKMPSSPYIHPVFMVDVLKELQAKEYKAFKEHKKYPLVIINKNYTEVAPQDKVCSVWLKDVRIYVITNKTEVDYEYDKRERFVLQPLLLLADEVTETIRRSCKFNLTNKGHNTTPKVNVPKRPYILSLGEMQNQLKEVVECFEIHYDYLKVLNL